MDSKSRIQNIQTMAKEMGIPILGISGLPTEDLRIFLEDRYSLWIEEGRAGSMEYLKNHIPLKFNPSELLPGCQSVIVAGLPYFQKAPWTETGKTTDDFANTGRFARYAWGRDYHKTFKKKLLSLSKQLYSGVETPGSFNDVSENFRVFVDSGPVDERFFAQASGIGFTGRHTLTINHQYGSWFFLGIILTTEKLPSMIPKDPYDSQNKSFHGTCPSGCSRCLQICPTGALTASGVIDGSRCISYLTIEHRGSIPVELRPKMGNWIFGCDLCQEVCPFNLKVQETTEKDFLVHKAGSVMEIQTLLGIKTDEEFHSLFAGSPIMRAKRVGIVRNACIAAGNSGRKELIPPLLEVLNRGEDPVIEEHAQWALNRIHKTVEILYP